MRSEEKCLISVVKRSLLTCLCELSHLTGIVVGQAGNRAQRGLPVATSSLTHVTDKGVQQGVGRLSMVGEGVGKKTYSLIRILNQQKVAGRLISAVMNVASPVSLNCSNAGNNGDT